MPKKTTAPSQKWIIAGLMLGLGSLAALPASANVEAGVRKYQAGDYAGALAEWTPLAQTGDANALFNVAQAYRLGRGVTADMKTAATYYEKAAAAGHIPAKANLGTVLYFTEGPVQDKARAVKLWREAAAQGEPRALYMLGVLHFNADGVEKDWPKALAYVRAAKTAGVPEANEAYDQMMTYLTAQDRTKSEAIQVATMALPGQTTSGPLKVAVTTPKAGISLASATAITPAPVAPPAPTPTPAPAPTPAPKAIVATPLPATKATPVVATPAVPQPVQVATIAPAKAAPAAPPKTTPSAQTGPWRIQLGAFSNAQGANRAWESQKGKYPTLLAAHQPSQATVAGIVKLQAGTFTTREEAKALCDQLVAKGGGCFPVKATQ